MVQVAAESDARLKGEIKVAYNEFDFVLHALNYFKHLSSRCLLTSSIFRTIAATSSVASGTAS